MYVPPVYVLLVYVLPVNVLSVLKIENFILTTHFTNIFKRF
jgi:hypothetical protein